MADILLNNLMPLPTKVDLATPPRGQAADGPSFDAHLGPDWSRRGARAASVPSRSAEPSPQRSSDEQQVDAAEGHDEHLPAAASQSPDVNQADEPETIAADAPPRDEDVVDSSAAEAVAGTVLQFVTPLQEPITLAAAAVERVAPIEATLLPEPAAQPTLPANNKQAIKLPDNPAAQKVVPAGEPTAETVEAIAAEQPLAAEATTRQDRDAVDQAVVGVDRPAGAALDDRVEPKALASQVVTVPVANAVAQETVEQAEGRDRVRSASSTPTAEASPTSHALDRVLAGPTSQVASPTAVAAAGDTAQPHSTDGATPFIPLPIAAMAAEKLVVTDRQSATPADAVGSTGEVQQRLAGLELRDFSPRLGPSQAASDPQSHGLSQFERVQLAQRVVSAMQTAAADGGVLRLRLSPPELGSLRMEVAVRDGVLHARIEAETPQAQAVLLENLPSLRERLAERDMRLGRFDVDVPNRQPGEGWNRQFQGDRRQADGWGSTQSAQQRTPETTRSESAARVTREGGLDVIV